MLQVRPQKPEQLILPALYLKMAGEFSQALAWLENSRIQQLCENHAEFFYLLAQCHAELGALPAAKDALNKACTMDDDLKERALDDPAFEAIYGADPDSGTR